MRVSARACVCARAHAFAWLCVQVCAYMCASVCLQAVCGAEQSRERKTDRSVTAHFPAHYRQQGLMGAYNEGPCLGLVKGEHSPNSTHPSSALSPLSSCYTLLYIPRGLWSCLSPCFASHPPLLSHLVCLLLPFFPPSLLFPRCSTSSTHLTWLARLPSTLLFLPFRVLTQTTWTRGRLAEAQTEHKHTHTHTQTYTHCAARCFSNTPLYRGLGTLRHVWPVFLSLWQGISLCVCVCVCVCEREITC